MTNRTKRSSNAHSGIMQMDSNRPSKTYRGKDDSKDHKVNATTIIEKSPFGLPDPVHSNISTQIITQSRNNGVFIQKSEVHRRKSETNDEFKSQKEIGPKFGKQTSHQNNQLKPTIEGVSPPKRPKKLIGSFVTSSDIHTPFTARDEYHLQGDNSPKKGKGLFSSQVSGSKKPKEPDSKFLPPTKTPQQNFLKKNASQALLPKKDLGKVDSKILPSKNGHRGSGAEYNEGDKGGGKHGRHLSSNFIKVEKCIDGSQQKIGKNDLDENVQKLNSVQNILNKVGISNYKIEGFTKSTQPEYDQNEEDEFFDHMLKEKDLETLLMDFPMEELYLEDDNDMINID